jgi:hypothetical protein
VTPPDAFLGQLAGVGTLCFHPWPGYRLAVTVQHVGTDYVRVLDGQGRTLVIPVGVIASWQAS